MSPVRRVSYFEMDLPAYLLHHAVIKSAIASMTIGDELEIDAFCQPFTLAQSSNIEFVIL